MARSRISLRALSSGYYKVFSNGVLKSKHITEREAAEAAMEHVLLGASDVKYVHDYTVVVEATIPEGTFATTGSGNPVTTGSDQKVGL